MKIRASKERFSPHLGRKEPEKGNEQLSEAGYLAAAGGDSDRMKRFVRALVEETGGKIRNEGGLSGFAEWYDGVTHTDGPRSLGEMVLELKQFSAAGRDWVHWPQGFQELQQAPPAAPVPDKQQKVEQRVRWADQEVEIQDAASAVASQDPDADAEEAVAAVASLKNTTMNHLGSVDCKAAAMLAGATYLLPNPFTTTLPTVQLAVCCGADVLRFAGRAFEDTQVHWKERTGAITAAEAIHRLHRLPPPKSAKTPAQQKAELAERINLVERTLDTLGVFKFCKAIGAAVESHRIWQLGKYVAKGKVWVKNKRLEGRLQKELQLSSTEAKEQMRQDFAVACAPVKKASADFPEQNECGRELDGCGGYVYFGARRDGRCTARQSFCKVERSVLQKVEQLLPSAVQPDSASQGKHTCEICDDACHRSAPCRWMKCNGMKFGRLLTAKDVALAEFDRCSKKCMKLVEEKPDADQEIQGCFQTCQDEHVDVFAAVTAAMSARGNGTAGATPQAAPSDAGSPQAPGQEENLNEKDGEDLDEEGYLAAIGTPGSMGAFVRKVVERTGGEILNVGDLAGFAAWYDGKTHMGPRSLAGMLEEFRHFHEDGSDWVRWPSGFRDPTAAASSENEEDQPPTLAEKQEDGPDDAAAVADDEIQEAAAAVASLRRPIKNKLGKVDCKAVAKLAAATALLPDKFTSTFPTVQLAVCCGREALAFAGKGFQDAKVHWKQATGQITAQEAVMRLQRIPPPKGAKTEKQQKAEIQERINLVEEKLDNLGAFKFCTAIGDAVERHRVWQLGKKVDKGLNFLQNRRVEGKLRKELNITAEEAKRRLDEDFAAACDPVKKTREDFPAGNECGRAPDGCGGFVHFGTEDGRCVERQSFCKENLNAFRPSKYVPSSLWRVKKSTAEPTNKCAICDDKCFAFAPCRYMRCNGMKYGRLTTAEDVALVELDRCMKKCGETPDEECYGKCRQDFEDATKGLAPAEPPPPLSL